MGTQVNVAAATKEELIDAIIYTEAVRGDVAARMRAYYALMPLNELRDACVARGGVYKADIMPRRVRDGKVGQAIRRTVPKKIVIPVINGKIGTYGQSAAMQIADKLLYKQYVRNTTVFCDTLVGVELYADSDQQRCVKIAAAIDSNVKLVFKGE